MDDDPSNDDSEFLGPEERLSRSFICKEKGNDMFKEGNSDKALLWWKSGLNLLQELNEANTGDFQVQNLIVVLNSNLAMVYAKIHDYGQAIEAADAAISIDESKHKSGEQLDPAVLKRYVKALYRRGFARWKVGQLQAAATDLTNVLKLDSSVAGAKRSLREIKKLLAARKEAEKAKFTSGFFDAKGLYEDKEVDKQRREEEKRVEAATKRRQEEEKRRLDAVRAEEESAARKKRWEDDCVGRMVKGDQVESYDEWDAAQRIVEEADRKSREAAEAAEKLKAKAKPPKARSSESEVVVDTEDDLGGINMRGYKTTADGRRTTFFNTDMDEATKKLIGDNSPQKIEKKIPVPSLKPSAAQAEAATPVTLSAWNTAGTWEEKNMTDWAMSRLKELLTACPVCPLPENSDGWTSARVVGVKDLLGDAQICQVRGKKRHLLDFCFRVEVEVWDRPPVLSSGGAGRRVKGALVFSDVSGDDVYDPPRLEKSSDGAGSSLSSSDHQAVLQDWVAHPNQGIQPLVIACITQFIVEYNSI
eukprot:CAMPEP_0185746954 /NCGR_PEP_ID=MMETSP1174-20130828/5620_1 /TAXON_ID=35687 /ORGANISM="Dictyocha speculum, Strain CCMP1381" /LENGTH=531 /DNA_ID=CAMNT_0028421935 /DNA_START=6 /DNA_END=1601 /DNA_ORIENTATION=-